jgi:hypothetical protein
MQAQSIREQLDELKTGAASESVITLGKKLSELLEGPEAAAETPTLKKANSTFIELYKEVEKADYEPTVAQVNAFAKMAAGFDGLLKRWRGLKAEISAINPKLTGAGLPELRLDRPPEQEAGGENEE